MPAGFEFGFLAIPIVIWIGIKIFSPLFFSQTTANKVFKWSGFLVVLSMWLMFFYILNHCRHHPPFGVGVVIVLMLYFFTIFYFFVILNLALLPAKK